MGLKRKFTIRSTVVFPPLEQAKTAKVLIASLLNLSSLVLWFVTILE